MFVGLNYKISQDNNAASFHLQKQDALGNSKATSFGSLRCQVKVRSRGQDSPAVYLKKGRLVRLVGLGPQWLHTVMFGAGFQQVHVRRSQTVPLPTPHPQSGFSELHPLADSAQHAPQAGTDLPWDYKDISTSFSFVPSGLIPLQSSKD